MANALFWPDSLLENVRPSKESSSNWPCLSAPGGNVGTGHAFSNSLGAFVHNNDGLSFVFPSQPNVIGILVLMHGDI